MTEAQLKASIAKKAAAYKAANNKPPRATFKLPVALVGYTFPTNTQKKELGL